MSDALRSIAQRLAALYDIEAFHIEPFLCDEEQARAAVGDEVHRGEVLLVLEEPDGVSVGLYVAESALGRLAGEDTGVSDFEAFCLAAEGVSHLVYLVFRAQNDDRVTQLELELQAEVDKYATAVLEGHGVGLIRERSQALRRQLFERVEYLDAEGTEAGDRYRVATRAAARYAARLERVYLARGDVAGFIGELRRFYRLGAGEKLTRTGH